MMLGRNMRATIPTLKLKIRDNHDGAAAKCRQLRKDRVKQNYDRKSRVLPKLTKGKNVYKKTPRDIGRQGQIVDEVKDMSYTLQSNDGFIHHRNRMHI